MTAMLALQPEVIAYILHRDKYVIIPASLLSFFPHLVRILGNSIVQSLEKDRIYVLFCFGCNYRYAADSVLGVATLPMKLLMEQTVIDGYAPVQGTCNVGGKVEDVSMLII